MKSELLRGHGYALSGMKEKKAEISKGRREPNLLCLTGCSDPPPPFGLVKYLAQFLFNHYLITYTHSSTMCEHTPGIFE